MTKEDQKAIEQVEATLRIEGMEMTDELRQTLIDIVEGRKTSDQAIEERKQRIRQEQERQGRLSPSATPRVRDAGASPGESQNAESKNIRKGIVRHEGIGSEKENQQPEVRS